MSPTKGATAATLCASLTALLISVTARAQSHYLVPDPSGCGAALNNNGEILCRTGLYSNNTFTPFPAGFTGSAFNDSGVVAGYSSATHLAIFSAGVVTDLADLSAPPNNGTTQQVGPGAINASGQIAGIAFNGAYDNGFVYTSGTVSWLPASDANGVNDSGEVVGCSILPPSQPEAFSFANGVRTDLGPGCATAINSSGVIAGWRLDTSNSMYPEPHAAVSTNGKLTPLGEPSPFQYSQAVAINSGGQIVGFMSTGNATSAFFYNGVVNDINSLISASDPLKSMVTINNVSAINDSRLMLVTGISGSGQATSYLLQAPWLDVAPGPLTFADQDVGTKSPPQTLTLTNSGTAPLSLDSISIAAGAADFSQTNACPPSMAAGTNCTVSVIFSPSKPGDQSSSLDVVTAGATIIVPLAATGAITIAMSASPAAPTVGQMFTITWTATTGAACQSSGGSANDGWSASTASGSTSVIEAQPGIYTYNLSCSAGSVSAVQSIKVTVANPPPSGGGGALDLCSLFLLGGLLTIRWRWGGIRTHGRCIGCDTTWCPNVKSVYEQWIQPATASPVLGDYLS